MGLGLAAEPRLRKAREATRRHTVNGKHASRRDDSSPGWAGSATDLMAGRPDDVSGAAAMRLAWRLVYDGARAAER